MRYQADITKVYTYRQWLPWRPEYALSMDERVRIVGLVRERAARPMKRVAHFRSAMMRPAATSVVEAAEPCCCEWCGGCHQ